MAGRELPHARPFDFAQDERPSPRGRNTLTSAPDSSRGIGMTERGGVASEGCEGLAGRELPHARPFDFAQDERPSPRGRNTLTSAPDSSRGIGMTERGGVASEGCEGLEGRGLPHTRPFDFAQDERPSPRGRNTLTSAPDSSRGIGMTERGGVASEGCEGLEGRGLPHTRPFDFAQDERPSPRGRNTLTQAPDSSQGIGMRGEKGEVRLIRWRAWIGLRRRLRRGGPCAFGG